MHISELGKYALKMFATGSRVICNPPVLDTDEDYMVFTHQIEALQTYLLNNGWEYSTEDSYEGEFISMVKGNINLIITSIADFYSRSYYATLLAKRLNLTNKQDRIDLFHLARYGSFGDNLFDDLNLLEGN